MSERGGAQDQPFLQGRGREQVPQSSDAPLKRSLTMVLEPVYEIRVAGAVPETDLRDMGVITVAPDQVNTILYGITDQAAL